MLFINFLWLEDGKQSQTWRSVASLMSCVEEEKQLDIRPCRILLDYEFLSWVQV